jgi:hypothetical protein
MHPDAEHVVGIVPEHRCVLDGQVLDHPARSPLVVERELHAQAALLEAREPASPVGGGRLGLGVPVLETSEEQRLVLGPEIDDLHGRAVATTGPR